MQNRMQNIIDKLFQYKKTRKIAEVCPVTEITLEMMPGMMGCESDFHPSQDGKLGNKD